MPENQAFTKGVHFEAERAGTFNSANCDPARLVFDSRSKMNGKNPVRGMSLMPLMLSRGKKTIPE